MTVTPLRIIAAGAILALTACSSPSSTSTATSPLAPTPAATATSDGAFTLYAGRSEDLIGPLVSDFEAETGIRVDVRYAGTTELSALLLEEGARTPADVFLAQDAGALGAVSRAGLFATLPASLADAVPAGFTSTDGTWLGVTGRARVIVYDGETLDFSDVPGAVGELTDPRWRGRVGIAPTNASFQSFVTAMRVLEGDEATSAWLDALVANDVKTYSNNTSILEAANAGEIQLGLINHYYWYVKAAEIGADAMRAQLSFPEAGDPGAVVNVTGVGLLAPAATDADALAFLAYLVSETGQAYFVGSTFEYPLAEGVAAPKGLPELASLTNPGLDLSDLDDLAGTTALLAAAGLI